MDAGFVALPLTFLTCICADVQFFKRGATNARRSTSLARLMRRHNYKAEGPSKRRAGADNLLQMDERHRPRIGSRKIPKQTYGPSPAVSWAISANSCKQMPGR